MGGDEFGIIFEDLNGRRGLALTQRIVAEVRLPCVLSEGIAVSVSAGIAFDEPGSAAMRSSAGPTRHVCGQDHGGMPTLRSWTTCSPHVPAVSADVRRAPGDAGQRI